jgi:hypothetical protein
LRTLGTVAVLLFAFLPATAPARAQSPPAPAAWDAASYELTRQRHPRAVAECMALSQELIQAVREWLRQGGKHVDWDTDAFWARVRTPVPPVLWYGQGMLVTHIGAEEGSAYPLRSGYEVAFYERLKQRLAASPPWVRLSRADLLTLGLESCADGAGHANISLAFLTIHNVMRALARPRTWFDDWYSGKWNQGDSMLPVLEDLAGKTPGSLPALLSARFNVVLDRNKQVVVDPSDQSDNANKYWAMKLFGGDGAFEALRGTPEKAANGGAHYYFWAGALWDAEVGLDQAGHALEFVYKGIFGNLERARRQLVHYDCGAVLSEMMHDLRGTLNNEGALLIAAIDYPAALPMGQSGDLRVYWQGQATFPVTFELQPAQGCVTDCGTLTTSATSRELPLIAHAFLVCGPGVQPVSRQYRAVLSDAGGQRTAEYPVSFTCLPTTRGGVVNVSGGLDPASVEYQVKKWDDRGFTFVFSPSFASFQLFEDGTAKISDVIVFKEDNFLRADPAHNYGHVRRTFRTQEGRGDVSRAGGKLWQCLDWVWYWGQVNHQTCDETWSEQSWVVERQQDGSYLLKILNGMPAGYADIPYRLR